jgi:UDP-N-acetylmuramoyl-L-alanyl-D-glutamate--2,6-diaminopimelate ligase
MWGVPLEVAVLTNIGSGEHMDYHGTFADYVRTKALMFPGAPFSVLPRDDEYYDFFKKYVSGMTADFSRHDSKALISCSDIHLASGKTDFHLCVKNTEMPVTVSLTGEHNVENILAAVTAVQKFDIPLESCVQILSRFQGLPGRLESIQEGQKFTVLVDHTYKPPALRAVLETLKKMTKGKLIVVWGGTGHRLPQFWSDSGAALHKFADEIVLTTDDPYDDDPRKIASHVKKEILRKEGEHFFEITDRYEAIRYALLTAESEDTVLIAGRGCEQTQTIGKFVIPFDDREVCREILRQGRGKNF